MGRRGPQPKTLELIDLTGNAGKHDTDYEVPDIPDLEGDLKAPPTLSAAGKRFWRRVLPVLQEAGIIKDSDLPTFEILSMLYGDLEDIRMNLRRYQGKKPEEKGIVAYLKEHNSQTGLLYTAYQKTMTSYKTYCGLFGLSPVDRSTLKISGAEKKSDFQKFQEKMNQENAG